WAETFFGRSLEVGAPSTGVNVTPEIERLWTGVNVTPGIVRSCQRATATRFAIAARRPSPPPTAFAGPEAAARIGPVVAIPAAAAAADSPASPLVTTRAYSPCVGCDVNGDGATWIVYSPWPCAGTWKWMVTVGSPPSWASSKATKAPLGS